MLVYWNRIDGVYALLHIALPKADELDRLRRPAIMITPGGHSRWCVPWELVLACV